jgi:hypothetical protein
MRKAANKALYLFLCSILGMVLFAMLHRAIFVLYDLLIFVDSTFSFNMSSLNIQILDFCTLLIALFLGGWYGTLLGIDWYAMVYGPNAEKPAGLFHGFLPHQWRGKRGSHFAAKPARMNSVTSKPSRPTVIAPTSTTTTVKVPVVETPKAPVREWTFDDLITPKPVAKKKTAVRKTAAKKTVRKTAVKKVVKAEKTE